MKLIGYRTVGLLLAGLAADPCEGLDAAGIAIVNQGGAAAVHNAAVQNELNAWTAMVDARVSAGGSDCNSALLFERSRTLIGYHAFLATRAVRTAANGVPGDAAVVSHTDVQGNHNDGGLTSLIELLSTLNSVPNDANNGHGATTILAPANALLAVLNAQPQLAAAAAGFGPGNTVALDTLSGLIVAADAAGGLAAWLDTLHGIAGVAAAMPAGFNLGSAGSRTLLAWTVLLGLWDAAVDSGWGGAAANGCGMNWLGLKACRIVLAYLHR
jgi:hypothetical protein